MYNYQFPFEKLNVWNDALELALKIYELTEDWPEEERYGLISQSRRSSFSVSNNLAEGTGRKTGKGQARFTENAYSSLMETMNVLIFANRREMVEIGELNVFRNDIHQISNQLNSLYNYQIKR